MAIDIENPGANEAALSAALQSLTGWALAGLGNTATGIWDHSVDGSSASIEFTGLAGASEILVETDAVGKAVSGLTLVQVSVDNGATWMASPDYGQITSAGVQATGAGAACHDTSTTSARWGYVLILGANIDGARKTIMCGSSSVALVRTLGSESPINAVRVIVNAGGNLTSGKITVKTR